MSYSEYIIYRVDQTTGEREEVSLMQALADLDLVILETLSPANKATPDRLAALILNGLLSSWCCDPHALDQCDERFLVEQACRLAHLMREEAKK